LFHFASSDPALAAADTGFRRGSPGPKFYSERDNHKPLEGLPFPWPFINIYWRHSIYKGVTHPPSQLDLAAIAEWASLILPSSEQ